MNPTQPRPNPFRPWLALLLLPLCFQTLVWAQSLWHDDISRSLVADRRASGIGDILTIVVSEISSANKNNETKTEKNSSWTAAFTSFLYPGFLQYKGTTPAVQYNSDLKHDGSGAINNSETIVAQVTVKVTDVLPNHNLVIEGKRETSFAASTSRFFCAALFVPRTFPPPTRFPVTMWPTPPFRSSARAP